MAVPAVYQDSSTPPTNITARWHNKLVKAGEMDGGFDVSVIEGIDRLVFNEAVLLEATSAETGDPVEVVLRRNGLVVIPKFSAAYYLDAREPGDGPLSIYWMVSRARNASPFIPESQPPSAPAVGYRHSQSIAQAVWYVQHNLGYRPAVSVTMTGGEEVDAEVFHVDANSLTVSFNVLVTGEVRCV